MLPPIQWAGSKRSIIKHLTKNMPVFETYYELFAGSCTLLFELEPKQVVINDIDPNVFVFYKILKSNPTRLLQEFKKLPSTKNTFESVKNSNETNDFCRAVNFLYMTTHSFHGLVRYKDGKFVSSYGYCEEKRRQRFYDRVLDCSKYFKKTNVDVFNENYTFFIDKLTNKDFVYLDPPYSVNENCIGKNTYNGSLSHEKLLQFCKYLDKNSVKFMLSNSYSEKTFKDYSAFNIEIISVHRSFSNKKTIKQEILVRNY